MIVNIGGAYGGIARLVEGWLKGLAVENLHLDYLCPAFSNYEAHKAHISRYCHCRFSREMMQLINPGWSNEALETAGVEGYAEEEKEKRTSMKSRIIKTLVPNTIDECMYGFKVFKRSKKFFLSEFAQCPSAADLVHIHAGSYGYVPGCVNAVRSAWPEATVWVHFHNPPVFGRFTFFDKAIIAKQVDRLLYASYSAKKAWDELYGFPNEAEVLQNGVDVSFYKPRRTKARETNEAFVFGTCARLTSVKRVDLMLQAVKLLVDQKESVEFRIAGDGQERAALTKKAVKLGIGKHVQFVGEVKDVRPFLSQIDCFVMASRTEGGVPLALLEAMALGIPAISTCCGGAEEVLVDGETGILVRDETPHGLAHAMNRMMQNPDLVSKYCVAARKSVVGHFNADLMTERLGAMYLNC